MLFSSEGVIKYFDENEYKLILEIDQGIVDYYKSLIPKYFYVKPQKYPAHISVVRNEIPPNLKYWKKHEGKIIDFQYTGQIKNGQFYWWIDAFSNKLEMIRLELNLSIEEKYTIPPYGYFKTFHITLGNMK